MREYFRLLKNYKIVIICESNSWNSIEFCSFVLLLPLPEIKRQQKNNKKNNFFSNAIECELKLKLEIGSKLSICVVYEWQHAERKREKAFTVIKCICCGIFNAYWFLST